MTGKPQIGVGLGVLRFPLLYRRNNNSTDTALPFLLPKHAKDTSEGIKQRAGLPKSILLRGQKAMVERLQLLI